uniref:Caf2 n=2 Tax=Arundo donax TaxID=35708 RepID=A0A0A9F3I9_ARUDO
MLWVKPSLPMLSCRLWEMWGLTSARTSAGVRGSPSTSSRLLPSPGLTRARSSCLLPLTSIMIPCALTVCGGSCPSGVCSRTPRRRAFSSLVSSGAFPVHGLGMVGGAKGRNAGSRMASGGARGASE